MTVTAIVTTVLSVLALGVSLVTLYLTYFHKRISLVGCLAEYWVDEPDSLVGVVFDFAFSNTGNKDLLIRKATVDLPEQSEAMLPELECKEIPAVIKPDHVVLVKLEVPQLFLRNAAKAKALVAIDFEVFGPGATSYHLSKALFFKGGDIAFTPKIWEPFNLEKKA